jgi:hypothetical protein
MPEPARDNVSPPEVRLSAIDCMRLVLLVLVWSVCASSYFLPPPPPPPPPPSAAERDRALNDAFAAAVSACACMELGPARSALAARAPPEAADAARIDALTAALSRCADDFAFSSPSGVGASMFATCLGADGIACFARRAAAGCPTGLPCFADAVAADLATHVPGLADALAAASAAVAAASAAAASAR